MSNITCSYSKLNITCPTCTCSLAKRDYCLCHCHDAGVKDGGVIDKYAFSQNKYVLRGSVKIAMHA
jgi:hypothetical protein